MESKDWKIIVEFGKSPSPYYSDAVEEAKQHSTYRMSEDKHKVTFTIDELDDFFDLIEIVSEWKSTSLRINDEKFTYSNELLDTIHCYNRRLKSYDPHRFCYRARLYAEEDKETNFFGCIFCRYNTLGAYFSEYAIRWYKEGKFDSDKVFHVNKSKIEHNIKNDLELAHKVCPILNLNEVLEKVKKLPDIIDPEKDSNWEYVDKYDNNMKRHITGVAPIPEKGTQSFPEFFEEESNDDEYKEEIVEVDEKYEWLDIRGPKETSNTTLGESNTDAIAKFVHSFYESLQNEGFTQEEAFNIIKETIQISLSPQINMPRSL